MSNTISTFKNYLPLLDEVYANSSLTAVLDGEQELARQGVNANELVIPKITMDGLANYDRKNGYVDGEVTLTNETVTCNFDRARLFSVDALDDAETAGIAFGRLASEFIRTRVVPELDAFRMATYASVSGIGAATPADLTTGAAVIAALRDAANAMDDAEVPAEQRYLFITHGLMGLVEDLDLTSSTRVLERFEAVVRMPQSRMYTAITQFDGSSSGQTAGGYVKRAASGSGETAVAASKNINFMVIHKGAVIQFQKHVAPKVIAPDQNQHSDAWKFGYRNVGIADVYKNKLAGVYLHAATA